MNHPVVSRDEWLAARKQLLLKEKEFTRLRDQLSADRRALNIGHYPGRVPHPTIQAGCPIQTPLGWH